MSNDTRSAQRDEKYPTKYSFMIPTDARNKIRSVTIHHENFCIAGFRFFDKDGALIWEIGYIEPWLKKETVVLAENEVIVGVVSKLASGFLSVYTDF